MRCLRAVAFVGLSTALASPLSAQAAGLVVRNAGIAQGLSIGAVYGRGRRTETAGTTSIDGLGARLQAGLGPAGVSIGVARSWFEPAGGVRVRRDELTAAVAMTVFGGPLVPLKVSWQAGGSRGLGADRAWRGSLGLGAALTIPATVLSIRPWVAPRIDYLGHQAVHGSRFKTAMAAGVDFGLLSGLGLQIEYDSRLGWDGGSGPVSGIGLGISHHF